MKKLVLFIVFAVSGCVSVNRFDNLEDRVDRLRKELNRTQNYQDAEKAEKLTQLAKANNRAERYANYFYELTLSVKSILKLIKELQYEDVVRYVETAQTRKDLADVCALLRKHHKIPKDHICFLEKTKKLQSNPKTENEIILEEFNKRVKRTEQRRKKR